MTFVFGLVELTARDATAAVAAGCWPHLATGCGREASVYLQVSVWRQQTGSGSSGRLPARRAASHVGTALQQSMLAQAEHIVACSWATAASCLPDAGESLRSHIALWTACSISWRNGTGCQRASSSYTGMSEPTLRAQPRRTTFVITMAFGRRPTLRLVFFRDAFMAWHIADRLRLQEIVASFVAGGLCRHCAADAVGRGGIRQPAHLGHAALELLVRSVPADLQNVVAEAQQPCFQWWVAMQHTTAAGCAHVSCHTVNWAGVFCSNCRACSVAVRTVADDWC